MRCVTSPTTGDTNLRSQSPARPSAPAKVYTPGAPRSLVVSGVSPDELAVFGAAGGVPVVMGTTVLRTSTAGATALTILRTLAELRQDAAAG